MTIELHQPEAEALLRQRMAVGSFPDMESALIDALRSAPSPSSEILTSPPKQTLMEVFEMIHGLADDLDFSRERSPDRPVDIQ